MSAKIVRLAVKLDGALPDAPERTKWIQVAHEGEYAGHPAGDFALTKTKFEEIIQNFNRLNAQTDTAVPVKYGHGGGDGAPAAGRIIDLSIEPNPKKPGARLMALVRFTPRAWPMIENEEYFSCSVELNFKYPDPVTGKSIGTRLTGVALTNSPFLLGMDDLLAASSEGGVVLTPREATPTRRSNTVLINPEILVTGVRRR